MLLASQKHLFSLPEGLHYLNNAYKAPLLKSAEEAAVHALIKARNPAKIQSEEFFTTVKQVKKIYGKLINCHHSDLTIIPSTSYGMSTVFNNLKGSPGKKAVTVAEEFPSAYLTMERWCEEQQVEMVVVDPAPEVSGRALNEALLEAIDEQTAVVAISSVHWMNGIKFDLVAIGRKCKAVGATFIVDGTQSVGALSIDVQSCQIDALIVAAYKWLMGPYSIGLAYYSKKFHHGVPLEESWMNRKNASDFTSLTEYEPKYQKGAARFNMGESSNFIYMSMLHASLKQIKLWQPKRIQEYALHLTKPLFAYLSYLGIEREEDPYFTPHLFGLRLPSHISQENLKRTLKERHISVSVRGSALRVSVNVFNTAMDIEALISAIWDTDKMK
ncbi:MAG: aminotransferase class V-fold PLP-dependent enzyme [Bacteroidota bacterium]